MADSTKLIIEIETILKNLDRTLKGLAQVESQLKRITALKFTPQAAASINKAAIATQRLQTQQDKLALQAQRLANAQERVKQSTERLALSRQRLDQATARAAQNLGKNADAHVRAFRAIEKAAKDSAVFLGLNNKQLLSLGNSLRSIGQGFASVGATMSAALTVPLAAFGAATVDAAVRLDSLRRGLRAIVGSSEEARQQLARLTEIAKLPGIGFEEAIQGSIRLQAVGFSAKESEKALREFSNAVALTGGGRDELARITVQLGQLASKGKVLAQDLKPIIEAAPAVGTALRQAFGTVNSEDIQALGLSTEQFLNILVAQLNQLPRASAGAKNAFENFRDEVFRAAAAIGDALLPSLLRIVEVAGPAITRLAEIFSSIPRPIQLLVIGLGALVAATGPILFVFGQLTLGVGRLLVGLVELNATGILPTIRNLLAMGAAAEVAGAQTSAALGLASIGTAGVIGLGVALLAVVAGIVLYNQRQREAAKITGDQVRATEDQVDTLKQQIDFIDDLQTGVKRTTEEEERLVDAYESLNTQAKIRVAGISDEEKRLAALREELQKLLQLRREEQAQQAANLVGQIANSVSEVAVNERGIQSVTERIAVNNALVETLEREGRISSETRAALERLNISGVNAAQAIETLQAQSARLVEQQGDLRDTTIDTEKSITEQLETLRLLQRQTGLSTRELLLTAKSMGVFKGDVNATLPVLDAYIKRTEEATRTTAQLGVALSEGERRLNEVGERAEASAKRRATIIQSAAALSREISVSFERALKDIREQFDAVPELRAAVLREAQIQGKTVNEILDQAVESAFKGRSKLGTALRNAQEQLAKALADLALAEADNQATIQKQSNDRLLRENENAFKLNLRAYTLYLTQRAILTKDNLQLEINGQRELVDQAIAEQQRFLARAGDTGLPPAERVKAEAGANKAQEDAIKAQTKLLELEDRRKQADEEVSQALAEHAKDQAEKVRELQIEYADLTNRIEESLDAATDEKFRDALIQLALDQEILNKRIKAATEQNKGEELEQLQIARDRNQAQIDLIHGIILQERALNRLEVANIAVNRAKDAQDELEKDLTFQVEFRGLKEEEAIRQRLEGERKLADSLRVTRDLIQAQIDALAQAGRTPPIELLDFVRQINTELLGLGELSFSEKFRLVEKEFIRLNDERLQKIADVERAVRSRDIAEAEGLLLIRRINGLYVGDLEQQLELLKQIAAASNDASLQRQAQSAEETVKDANERLASFTTQLKSTSIDALREGFVDFFKSLRDNTQSAQEKLLAFLDSVVAKIEDVIAENLSQRLIESIFGKDLSGDKIIGGIKRIFGGGGGQQQEVIGEAATHGADIAQEHAAAAVLEAGAATAAATQTASATTFATLITTAATTFSAAVTAAAAAFAATVAASGAASAASGSLGSAFSGAGFAKGDILPAQAGGRVVRVAEGGHAEAVLTTDPLHAIRQARILTRFLRMTRGLGGRFPVPLAEGALISPREVEANVLSGLQRTTNPMRALGLGEMQLASAGGNVSVRNINQINRGEMVRGYLRSAEGTTDILNVISENAPEIGRRIGVR